MNRSNSIEEDDEDAKSLQKIAIVASDKAIRIAKAIIIIRKRELIEIYPNGEEKFFRKIEPFPFNSKELKKGSVICKKLKQKYQILCG